MTSTAAADFLTKELFIKKNVVTFRSLSRELSIHVNQAKNELATFYTNTRSSSSPSFPTYLISGEVSSLSGHRDGYGTQDDRMDVDFDEGEINPVMDIVPCTKMLLVNEDVLEETKAQFSRVYSTHIYSLSPSPIHDAGLVCGPTVMVRQADATKGPALSSIVGKFVGTHVKMGKSSSGPLVPSTSTTRLEPLEKLKSVPESREKPVVSSKDKSKEQEKPSIEPPQPAEKPKATGKLDWSKAKSKESKKPDATSSKQAGTSVSKKDKDKTLKPKEPMPKEDEKPSVLETKRGKKRKSPNALISDSEEDVESLQKSKSVAKNTVRVKKGMIMSDDEDEDEDVYIPKASRVAKIAPESDSERSLRAMMDIDDEHVINASKLGAGDQNLSGDDEDQEEDVDIAVDSEEDIPKPKPRKKREKKVVPIGRNGLKKKKVMKSRTTTDAKGYMITEDYSSYESVGEDEPDLEPPAKGKGKRKSAEETKPEKDVNPAPRVSKPKTDTSRASKAKSASTKRGSLLNFFGPESVKK